MHLAFRARWSIPAVLGLFFCFLPQLQAALDPIKVKSLRQQAEQFEQQAEWRKACDIYEIILRLDRNVPEIKERYQHCLRRYWQLRRHGDLTYRKEVLSIDYGQSLRLYTMIRDTLLDNALDKKSVDAARLFRRGLEEFDNALTDPVFLQNYLAGAKPQEIRNFRTALKKGWGDIEKLTRAQAVKQLREVALAAQNALNLDCTVVIMEFACGACYALDEYTLYLTPNQLRELVDSLRGEFGGVGLSLRAHDNKIVIAEVAAQSPAAEVLPTLKGDQVISIDNKPAMQLTLESAQDLLEGPIGSTVELELYSPSMGMRTVPLRRRALFMPSITYHMKNETVGYLHVACFQDTTIQEIDEALAVLARSQMKSLILDLRGNSGGLFEVSIDVARRFLTSGIITSTQNTDPKFSMVYHAKNPGAHTVPLIVLIDGDTASAAEVLAGALKDNKRGRLVGQTTFGKGCTQCIVKLPSAPGGIPTGGIRLTVARFFSPDGHPYTGRGVVPHLSVDRFAMSMSGIDLQMEQALIEAQRFLEMVR